MNIKLIKTKKEYKTALSRLEEIFDAKKGTAEGDELELIALLIEHYENQHFPISLPDPIEAIKFRMEQMGYTQNDLGDIIGQKSRASEVLNRKRKLSLEMIRQIHETMNIPTDVLVQAY